MKILVLMGGERITVQTSTYPIYMAEIRRKMLVEHKIEQCSSMKPSEMIFCYRREDVEEFRIDMVLKSLVPKRFVGVEIRSKTAGALCTALLAVEYLESDEEIVIVAVDELLDIDHFEVLNFFRSHVYDAAIVTFPSSHPRYSFARTNKLGSVYEVVEKQPISRNALASFYYFKNGNDFINCAKNVIRKDNKINGSFFLSQAINEMVLLGKNIGMFNIDAEKFHPLKTPAQFNEFFVELREKALSYEICKD